MRVFLLISVMGLFACTCFGQISLADTTRVRQLLKEGNRCMDKPGDEKRDLDSASRFALRALTLSRRLGYTTGEQDALLITALASLELKQWPVAHSTYLLLDSARRIKFLCDFINDFGDSVYCKPLLDSALPYIDSLLALLPAARTESLMHSAASQIGWFCHAIRDPVRGQLLLANSLRQVQRLENGLLEARFLFEAYIWLTGDSNYTPVVLSLSEQLAADQEKWLPRNTIDQQCRAIEIFCELGNQYTQSKTLYVCDRIESLAVQVTQRLHLHYVLPWCILATNHLAQGKTQEALALTLDAVRMAETPDGPFNAFGYEYAARIYFAMGDLEKGFSYFDKCISLLKKDPSLTYYPGALFMYAIWAHLKQHRPEEGFKLLKMIGLLHLPLDISDTVRICGITAETWYALGRNDSAETYYLKNLTYYRGNKFWKFQCYTNLAGFYIGTRQYAKAKPLLVQLTADSNRSFVKFVDQETNWRLRYRLDSAGHNYPQATADLLKYQFYHDSLVNDNKNKQLAEINVQYETEKKNQHIADLEKQSTLQTQLQQSTIRQNRIVRNSLIAGAIFLAFFTAILFFRWRTRRRMALRLEKLSGRQQKLLDEKEKLIGEKEWLLREIHHRVKNNLQIIISLLNMQAGQLKDEIAMGALQELGARVNTISLVHKKLYQETQHMAAIDMSQYIGELVNFLKETLAARQNINFQLDVQNLILDPTQCVPVGLILNEAITNAIKYAFPKGATRFPRINISLKEETENCITLIVADNGVGLPPGFDSTHSNSLGFQLIHTLTQQLDGTLDISSCSNMTNAGARRGLTTLIRFPWLEPVATHR